MQSVRLWILILIFVSFASGIALGLGVATWSRRPEPPQGAFSDYHRLLVDEFELSSKRSELLRGVLEKYQMHIEGSKAEHIPDYMAAIGPGLREIGQMYQSHIRDYVIPPNQRAQFDRLIEAGSWQTPDR